MSSNLTAVEFEAYYRRKVRHALKNDATEFVATPFEKAQASRLVKRGHLNPQLLELWMREEVLAYKKTKEVAVVG